MWGFQAESELWEKEGWFASQMRKKQHEQYEEMSYQVMMQNVD